MLKTEPLRSLQMINIVSKRRATLFACEVYLIGGKNVLGYFEKCVIQ